MAEGAWVPAFLSLWRGPKAAKLATYNLGQRRHAAGGIFLELMGWALDACESGDLGTVGPAVLAEAVGLRAGGGMTLEDRGRELLAALKAAGFVDDDERAHVKGWEDGPGKLIDRRRYERERKAERRSREAQGRVSGGSGDRQSGARAGSGGGQGTRLSQGTAAPASRPVPRDRVNTGAGLRPIGEAASRGRPTGLRVVVPGESRAEQSRHIPPTPQRGPRDEVPPEVAAELLITSAPTPWQGALEAFRGAFGNGSLLTFLTGSDFARGDDGLGIVTVSNDFVREFLTAPGKRYVGVLRDALAPAGITRLEFEARRRPMGEPEVMR